MNILVLNGPNLDKLGTRQVEIYGKKTLKSMMQELQELAKQQEDTIKWRQTSSEGELVDWINKADSKKVDAIILNPGAYTHYSVAIYDAIKCIDIPTVEVHLSNVFAREGFRREMVTTGACKGQICGFGPMSYALAYMALKEEDEEAKCKNGHSLEDDDDLSEEEIEESKAKGKEEDGNNKQRVDEV